MPPRHEAPWWVPYLFLAVYEAAIIYLTIAGGISPADFRADSALVLTAAFGVSISPTGKRRATDQALEVDAEGDVHVTHNADPDPDPVDPGPPEMEDDRGRPIR
jgi:hypothetical protein